MQTATWLGAVPGNDGQIKLAYTGHTPLTILLNSAANAVVSNPAFANPSSFLVMSKQAEAASK
jgi:cytoplasmic FMR1 interacting protein